MLEEAFSIESEALQIVHQVLFLWLAVLLTGMLAGKLAHFLKIPDVAVFLLAGIVTGPVFHLIHIPADSALNQMILVVGATWILFDGGRGIRFQVLKQVWPTIVYLSVPGVIITAAVTAVTAAYLLHLPMVYAWLLSSIIASTDPATLIPVFKQVRIDERVKQTVESESAFNDATGSILTFTVLGILQGTSTWSVTDSVLSFLKMAGGGIGIGLLLGGVAAFLLSERFGFLRTYAPVAYLTVAIASYSLADRFGFSGFMATFTTGVMLGNHASLRLPQREEQLADVSRVFDTVTLIMRMLIFILLGTQVQLTALKTYGLYGLGVVAVFMLIARPLAVLVCTLPDHKAKWRRNEILFMFWVRETGVIPAALVGLIAGMGVEHMDVIASVTFLAILITIVLQASTTSWVAGKLGLIVRDRP
jgi:cell volume regulation protein A